jgi:hypothetical protein
MEARNRSIRFQCHSLIFAAIAIGSLITFADGTAFAKKIAPLSLCVNHSGSGGCSTTIQGAVDMVPTGGSAIITIAASVTPYAEDVTVSDITVSFVGGGAGMTVVDGTNASGIPTFLFENNSNGELHGMTIQNGDGMEGSNVEFMQYASPKSSKGVGTLTIENCEITGGTHPPNIGPLGAIVFAGKTLTIDSSSISNNTNMGLLLLNAKSDAYITNTTISGNSTTGNTAGADGCGIHLSTSTLVLNNDTITDNHCIGGSGAEQTPTVGGGLYVDFPGKVTISNTVIANNTVVGNMASGPDCYAPGKGVKSKGFNLIKDTSACNIKLAKSDIAPGTDPALSSPTTCASSGLEVQTPLGGSPVIAGGNPGKLSGKVGAKGPGCLPTDECGTARTQGTCSIGATE